MRAKKFDRLKLGIVIALSLILVVIVAQNSVPVPGRFLWFRGEVSVVVLLIISAIVGFVLGILVALFTRREDRTRATDGSADPDSVR